MALGVIFIFLTPGYAPNLSAYLFGNILTISTADILWILGLVVLLILIFSLFLREIVYVAFDRDFAVTQGLPVKWIEYTMMCFITMTIVLSIRLVGIMLLMSLLTLPQITVNLFTSDFKKIMWEYRDRAFWVRLRTGSFLFPERAFRCVYHLVFGGPLFGLESNKTVVTALIK